tara:strand:- start:1733 stop:2131 length:399 start_codon:yes stop_codon:yes gene_type:complete
MRCSVCPISFRAYQTGAPRERKMIKKALALFAVLFLFSGPATADFDGYVEVTNNTGYDIYYLYVSHAKSKSWEEDVLDDDILPDGHTVRVNLRGAKSSIFDIRAKDEDGDTYTVWEIDVARDDVVFTLDDMD